jgi:hypothetical protein
MIRIMGSALTTSPVSKPSTDVTPPTPDSRREWAQRYAWERAAIGEHATVRELQEAVRAHFGRGLGNERACEIVNEIAQKSARQIRERNWSTQERAVITQEHATITQERNAPLTAIIVEAMRQLGVRRIELQDDGSLNMTPY